MKKNAKNKTSFVEALGRDNQYAVLTKARRIQILVQPTAKQLRKRGKRGWHLYGTVDSSADSGQTLIDTIQSAIQGMENIPEVGVHDGAAAKPSKKTSK